MKYINKVIDFILCFLMDKCIYSSKKLLAYTFSLVVIYLALFTVKEYYELLIFITVLLGLRSYDTSKTNNGTASNTNNAPAVNIDEKG
jgi:hypothetical protein